MKLLDIALCLLSTLITAIAGFKHGEVNERKKWNKLIDDGILPKPPDK